jgi:hypothetical protein
VTVSVIVPFRPDGAEREDNWHYLQDKWSRAFPEWELITGDCRSDTWIKADAIADALIPATGDIIVMADADVWCEGIEAAVIRVQTGLTWAIPHLAVHRLTEKSTRSIRNNDPMQTREYEEHPYEGVIGGGMFVMRRSAYEAAPIDRRFQGWGQEDQSAGMAWTTLYGLPWRGIDPLWHLWHPPMERQSRVIGSDESRALWERYRRANHNRPAMRELVGEGVEKR